MKTNHQHQARAFGIVLIAIEITMGFIYGFFVDYSHLTSNTQYFILIGNALLALLGFGLLLVYVDKTSVLSIVNVLILFALSLQLYFPFMGMWQHIRLSPSHYMNNSPESQTNLLPISLVNSLNDRQTSDQMRQLSLISWVQCLISLIVGYSGVLGRVGFLETLFLAVFGTLGYTFNQILFWKYFITDCGGAMRIFLYGGALGIVSGLILGQRETVADHPKFSSSFRFQTFGFVGSILIWILLPLLNWSDLYHPSLGSSSSFGKDGYILHTVSVNMWISLCGSCIGAFCASFARFKKCSIHEITHSLFTGGISYMAVSDLYFNPGVALALGTLSSFICTFCLNIKWRMNYEGVVDSTGVLITFMIPGLLASILSSIFHANTAQNLGEYVLNADLSRSRLQNGAFQLAGGGLSIAIGILAALLMGILTRIINHRQFDDQFTSNNHIIFNRQNKQE